MAKRATLGPDWLVSLLVNWGKLKEDSGLGYPKQCPMLRDGIPTQARSHEPTGYSEQDFSDVQRAVDGLKPMRKLAVMRFAKPWMIRTIDQEFRVDTDTWLYNLKQALIELTPLLAKTTQRTKETA